MVGWGTGDFFIQRCVRHIGVVKTLFYIALVGAVALFPFVVHGLPALWNDPLSLLLVILASTTMLFVGLFDFEALKEGKLSVVEPVISMELPITIALAIIFLGERLTAIQTLLMVTIFAGVLATVTTHRFQLHYHRRIMERGVTYAGLAAISLALTNVIVGFSSRVSSPLMTIWALDAGLVMICLVYLVFDGEIHTVMHDWRKRPREILLASIIDNAAWIFYAISTSLIPVSISNTINESYVAIAALLGIVVNHERLKIHQKIGVAVALGGVATLAAIS